MENNRFNLLLIIFLSMVLLFSLYSWMINEVSDDIKYDSINNIYSSKTILMEELISLGIDNMRPLIFDIARNETAMEAFYNDDKIILKEKLLPTYIRLSTIGTISSVQVFNKNNVLSFSAPNVLDNKASVLVKRSNIFKKVHFSPFYSNDNKLSLGISFPLYNGRAFAGSVLLARDFSHIIGHYNSHDDSTSTIITTEDFRNRKLPDIWRGLRMVGLYQNGFSIEKIGEKYFRIFAIPIIGSEKKVIAYVLNTKDFTYEYNKIKSKLDYFTIILLVTSIVITSFIYLYALRYSKIVYKKGRK